jgi:hypothetical protein
MLKGPYHAHTSDFLVRRLLLRSVAWAGSLEFELSVKLLYVSMSATGGINEAYKPRARCHFLSGATLRGMKDRFRTVE